MSQANLVDALAYIEANFDKTVSLAQLADLSALSVSRFATVFREQFGLSPYKYLCELRVQRAQTLLLAGVPGSVVATEVGFFDQSHLARHFKRLCGVTPSVFVERARMKGMSKRVAQSQPQVFAFDSAHVA
ncbi:AraC family transcriptional regulator [Caballeronia sp. INDeC2]|uniref:helix-turn-helix domain-containing protein n=1 Tax=Caballeronia sp. INDeC2 TaxID=2921747 RepID=UPI00202956D7|nr:AraC family transcriptional regulator [Caballeronia sp. INDeC2]